MRSEGFALHWRLPNGEIVGEPVIGWAKDHPINPTMYFPVTPAKPDTSTGEYFLSFRSGRGMVATHYWSVSGGTIDYYHEDYDDAVSNSGV